jgi:protein-arginine kinase activator protein McsA
LWADYTRDIKEFEPCPHCGTSWHAIDYSGLIGCPGCHEHFSVLLTAWYTQAALGSPRRALDYLHRLTLENALANAVQSEDYEAASHVRDQLDDWSRGGGYG